MSFLNQIVEDVLSRVHLGTSTLLGAALFSAVLLCGALLIRYRQLQRDTARTRSLLSIKEQQYAALQEELTSLKIRNGKLVTLLTSERKSHGEKLEMLDEARENLRLQFQTLAQQIFDEKSEKFGSESGERVAAILRPLREQIFSFQKRIDAIQADEIRERTSLKEEILHLKELNQQMNREAVNLTRALQGDKKAQGNWGELVLEKVLQKSGLRQGEEYTVQKGFRNRDNQLFKPDVIIHLPDGRDVIIDSKVPLSAWQRYVTAENDEQRQHHMKDHLSNLRSHVTGLSAKDYTELKGLNCLDFVLLFIPIDSCFAEACRADDQLFSFAYERRVVIITPSTLLATLRTVETLWRYEQQDRNAKEIAERAGAVHDKLCGFLEDMEKIGRQLSVCTTTYDSAMNKLATGRGNVIGQAASLTRLGVKTKKSLPPSLDPEAGEDLAN